MKKILFFQSQLHLAALASLKTEIVELTGKVQQLTEERDQLQASLAHATQERKDLIHDYEDRLTSQAHQSEQHITELQSVIAELNKKLSQSAVDKFDESEEHEIESQTSERGKTQELSLVTKESSMSCHIQYSHARTVLTIWMIDHGSVNIIKS